MKLSKLAVTSLVVAALVGGGSFIAARMSYAHEGGHSGPLGAWGHGRHCGMESGNIDKISAQVKQDLALNDSQNQQLDTVVTAIKSGHDKKEELHKEIGSLRDKPAPEKLAFFEKAMTEGLSTMQQVRPVFDAFYAGLTDEQKTKLEAIIKQHRHGFMRQI